MTKDNKAAAPQGADASPPPAPETGPPTTRGKKAAWVGAAAGIGSAAIVAALLYARRKP